ncbi:Flagellar motor rotation protein MotB [hydrothermal vent metagenome]|uniref:Flagellar motor rotation protein MotB n=1 Tax=hydrothermal vent metagenome TaxID=652676 RepID=A0A3B0YE34_9ZZZZ
MATDVENSSSSTGAGGGAEAGAESPVQVSATKPAAFAYFSSEHLFDDFGMQDCREVGAECNWSVPWSDLMMVMFVLFAALVAAQAMREQERVQIEQVTQIEQEVIKEVPLDTPDPQPVPVPQPDFAPLMRINVFESSKQALRQANLANVELVLMKDQSVKVSVQGPMLFEPGLAELRDEVKAFLAALAQVIEQTDFRVNVIGHTDDTPINTERFPSNWELSATRASRVARFILDQGDIDPARFTVMGRSQYQPTDTNQSIEARAENRRVEIIITRETVEQAESTEP